MHFFLIVDYLLLIFWWNDVGTLTTACLMISLSTVRRLAWAYHGLQISQAYINAVKNFERVIWNPTLSLSGYGSSLQKSSSQQV